MGNAEITNDQGRRRRVLGLVRLAILAILLVFVVVYVRGHWEGFKGDFSKLAALQFGTLAWVLLLECVAYCWYALMLRALMWPYGLDMGTVEAAMVAMATRFGNIWA